MKKKILAALLTLTLTAGFAACGGDTPTESASEETTLEQAAVTKPHTKLEKLTESTDAENTTTDPTEETTKAAENNGSSQTAVKPVNQTDPTEKETQKPASSQSAPVQPVTQAPAKTPTQPATQPATQAPTQAPTQKPAPSENYETEVIFYELDEILDIDLILSMIDSHGLILNTSLNRDNCSWESIATEGTMDNARTAADITWTLDGMYDLGWRYYNIWYDYDIDPWGRKTVCLGYE